jgi:hypothetical protein
LGAIYFGTVTFVYRKKRRREIQKYRVRWDDGSLRQLVSVEEGSTDVGGGGGADINEDTV